MDAPCPPAIEAAALATPAKASADLWRFHADPVLGTRMDVLVRGCDAETAFAAAMAARRETARLDDVFDIRRPNTELSRLNATTTGVIASSDLFRVMQAAARWRELSGGAFDERLGLATALLRSGAPEETRLAMQHARSAPVDLDASTRRILRAPGAAIDLDGIAKGYIIDRALLAARLAAPMAEAMLVSIGGDMAAWRAPHSVHAWTVGLPDGADVRDNTPLLQNVPLGSGAMATSGFGARDVVRNGERIGPTRALGDTTPNRLATVIAPSAIDADALATIATAMAPGEAIGIIGALPDTACRIVDSCGRTWTSARWQGQPVDQQAKPVRFEQTTSTSAPPASADAWPVDWRLELFYSAPTREDREADFRAPYMALWITDTQNRRVRTLYMVGRRAEWQRDNFVWWNSYRDVAEKVINLRSEPTAPSGQYAVVWDGRDDNHRLVKAGRYRIHIETSRERGRHLYRNMDIEIGRKRFSQSLPNLPQSGGFSVTFGHPNDRFQ